LPSCYIGIPPGELPSDDAYIKANSATSNFGSLPNIEVRPDKDESWRGLIRFDLSSIPSDSVVTQAMLFLYEKDEKLDQVTYIYRVTSSWDETSVTWSSPWNNPGGDYSSSNAYASFLPNQKNCMIEIDLTHLVQEWVSGTPNHGMLLFSTGPNHILRYSSKEEILVEQQPKLYVTYSAPMQTGTTIMSEETSTYNDSFNSRVLGAATPSGVPIGTTTKIQVSHSTPIQDSNTGLSLLPTFTPTPLFTPTPDPSTTSDATADQDIITFFVRVNAFISLLIGFFFVPKLIHA
jgi:hypothetical protein